MKAFEVAFRLGKFPAEMMARPFHELLDIIEYDQCAFDPSWVQWAMLYAKIDAATWRKGTAKPDAERYLPKVKTHWKAKTREEKIAEIKRRIDRVSK